MNGKELHRHGQTRAQVRDLPSCQHCNKHIGPGEGYEVLEDEAGRTIARHITSLYFDECSDGVRKTLRGMGLCIVPRLPKGTLDVDLLAHVGGKGWTFVTQDINVLHRSNEAEALARNKVKCFILPGEASSNAEQVRRFMMMWDKIRIESCLPGPFIWVFGDESRPSRWLQVLPRAEKFVPYDLSQVPVGHLLNLFADIVCQHDEGWFSGEFVNGLHDNIRLELEARISGDKSMVPTVPEIGEPLFSGRLGHGAGDTQIVKLDTPLNPAEGGILVQVLGSEEGARYIWLIPVRKFGFHTLGNDAGDEFTKSSYSYEAGPTGFCRSGFGLRLGW